MFSMRRRETKMQRGRGAWFRDFHSIQMPKYQNDKQAAKRQVFAMDDIDAPARSVNAGTRAVQVD